MSLYRKKIRNNPLCELMKGLPLTRSLNGGITLEAALITPMFIAFMFVLIIFIRLAVTDIALKSATVETTKLVATHLYPVELLMEEAKEKYNGSQIGSGINSVIERANSIQGSLENTEKFVDDYASWIPQPFISLIEWEKELRESVTTKTGEELQQFNDTVLQPKLNLAVKPIVYLFADQSVLNYNLMNVSKVNWPSLSDRDNAYLGIELTYRFPLHLPFFSKDLILKKKAYERIWLGA